jgi:hypothetical protein
MLVPGLPITELAIEAVVADDQRPASAAGAQARPGALREAVRTWQARLLFAACYAFVVGLVAMAG